MDCFTLLSLCMLKYINCVIFSKCNPVHDKRPGALSECSKTAYHIYEYVEYCLADNTYDTYSVVIKESTYEYAVRFCKIVSGLQTARI
jgi:hypothetical protein